MILAFIISTLRNVVKFTWKDMADTIIQRYIIKILLQKRLFKDKKLGGDKCFFLYSFSKTAFWGDLFEDY